MPMQPTPLKVSAIKVNQWLDEWNKVTFDNKSYKRRPEGHFYLFSLSANQLKALTGIFRRTKKKDQSSSEDLNIQRMHDPARSTEISKFIETGYPWSELSEIKKKSGQFDDLRKPGWLPTAIIVNILKPEDERTGQKVATKDLIKIQDSQNHSEIILPQEFKGSKWSPSQLYPIEVIDGQHRLWAFQNQKANENFELPVVAFYGLDISWQAYLFWTINIKPKRINASLAFDLYPLLRTEDWLEKFDGHTIYREARAQEITEALWSKTQSPWHDYINMLGDPGSKGVSQAAWIRGLLATYIKAWSDNKSRIGGLFGAKIGKHKIVLPWTRPQQTAFLIYIGQQMRESIKSQNEAWMKALRDSDQQDLFNLYDPAFYGKYTLLNTDQGIRGLLTITNDLIFANADDLKLEKWLLDIDTSEISESTIKIALDSIEKQPFAEIIKNMCNYLAKYDWRTSSAPGLSEEERTAKSVFRGGSGYGELRSQLLSLLLNNSDDTINKLIQNVMKDKEA